MSENDRIRRSIILIVDLDPAVEITWDIERRLLLGWTFFSAGGWRAILIDKSHYELLLEALFAKGLSLVRSVSY